MSAVLLEVFSRLACSPRYHRFSLDLQLRALILQILEGLNKGMSLFLVRGSHHDIVQENVGRHRRNETTSPTAKLHADGIFDLIWSVGLVHEELCIDGMFEWAHQPVDAVQ